MAKATKKIQAIETETTRPDDDAVIAAPSTTPTTTVTTTMPISTICHTRATMAMMAMATLAATMMPVKKVTANPS